MTTAITRARAEDFAEVFPLIQALWSYNRYDEQATRAVYEQIVAGAESFAFVARREGKVVGFAHGDFFPTLWMCGRTCYLSGLIAAESARRQGVGTALLDCVTALARARGARAVILDSGLPRTGAHRFYEAQGFTKSCYGFERAL